MRGILRVLCCIFLSVNVVHSKKKGSSSLSPSKPTLTVVGSAKENIRLVNRRASCSGLVQVKSDESWLYVCESTFSVQNGFVTCRDLGCGFLLRHYPNFESIESWSDTFNCSGQEEHLSDCPKTPPQTSSNCSPVVLQCDEKPMYAEVKFYSTVDERSRFLDSSLSMVYEGHPYLVKCSIDAPLKVRSFVLQINEEDTTEFTQTAEDNAAYFFLPPIVAPKTLSRKHKCVYNFEVKPETFSSYSAEYIDISAASYVRLEGEESRCLGRLELEHKGEWRPVSQQLWGLKEAAVVCRQLGCGSVVHTHTQSSVKELQPVWRFYSDCEGSERALLSCGSVRKGMSISTVHVICSDILLPVKISVESEKNFTGGDPIVVYSPYTFYINCTVPPQFPGGHFSLVFKGNNSIHTMNQTAVNHSTVFRFDSSEKAHSGKYSCSYHNTVLGHHISSRGQELSVAVEDAEDVKLDDGLVHDSDHTVCSGMLFVKDGPSEMMMVAAENNKWDMRHASIVCRELGCGDALSTSQVKIPTVTPMWRFFSDCDGAEAALFQCGDVFPWFSSTAIKVVCADKL